MNTDSCLFAHTLPVVSHGCPLLGVALNGVSQERKNAPELRVAAVLWVRKRAILGKLPFILLPLVDQQGCITTVIDNQIWAGVSFPSQGLLCAPPVLFQSFALPSKDSRL